MTMLTVNAGSSSLKVVLLHVSGYSSDEKQSIMRVMINGIGSEQASIIVEAADRPQTTEQQSAPDHQVAAMLALKLLSSNDAFGSVQAVGHRIVHGGSDYFKPMMITEDVQKRLRGLEALDPHHMKAALQLVGILQHQFPTVPHVACFDTGFFHDVPRVAQMTSLPREYESIGVRRYGFHGLSYQYLTEAFGALAGEAAVKGRVIYAHLGSGASIAATKDGRPVDMTMGFSPASGIMMSTRSGDLDPAVSLYIQQQKNMTPETFDHLVNFESGLLGVSGTSHDMRVLIDAMHEDEAAREAVTLFCYQVAKSIAALSSTIGGLDSLIFSGGIGENAPVVRNMVCEQLRYMGIALDDDKNQQHSDLISSAESQIGVHVIPSDESQTIVREVYHLIHNKD